MKVAQLLATIPDALPAAYAAELSQLQSQAPPMGWPFVRRRMSAELGPDWESRYASFESEDAAATRLRQPKSRPLRGNFTRARSLPGAPAGFQKSPLSDCW